VRRIVLVGLAAAFISSCTEGKTEQPKVREAVPVKVGSVAQKTLPVEIHAIGNVDAYSTVSIKARVGGDLTRVHFKEGHEVRKGDLLFQIDPRPYEATLAEAKARLAKDIALAKKAEEDARRYASLIEKQVVSQEQYDQVRANRASLDAAVKADEAAVENARLQLSYCSIYAPLSGRTGSLLLHEGNLIKANDDNKSLVVIRQIQPIYVGFSVPEQFLPEIKRHWGAEGLKVAVSARERRGEPVWGALTFMDNTVDTTTGTILLKATFPNQDKALWPGQFVDVAVTLIEQQDAIVVPSEAVQTGQQGQYVFVVRPDLTVEARSVAVDRTVGQEAVVGKGLAPGERVVTDGQLRLVPGARVEIKNSEGTEGITS
jgi:multidrug efflux system membrane fusion protein